MNNDELLEKIKLILRKLKSNELEVTLNSKLIEDLAIDSLTYILFLGKLEKELQISLEIGDFYLGEKDISIEEVIEKIQERNFKNAIEV